MLRLNLLFALVIFGAVIAADAGTGLPVIDHAPVKVAIAGQGVAIRTRVIGPTPKSVVLFVAASRDATPFKMVMERSGTDTYAATIPEMHLAGLSEIYYYIEARTQDDTPVETSWYTTIIKPAQSGAATPSIAGGAATKSAESERSWVKPVLIGGGLLAAGGIALAASSGGGGGDDGDDTPPTNGSAGTYVGTDTTCIRYPDGVSNCEATGVSFSVSDQGVVRSTDLRDGQTLEAPLSGNDFVLVGTVSENGFSGEIQYVGTVIDNRIVGSIQGSASSTAGVITFSGTFSAVK